MKIIFYSIIQSSLLLISNLSFGQQSDYNKIQSETLKNSRNQNIKPLQIIDVEILGSGLGVSAIYDSRFNTENGGFGLRTGLGFAFGLTIPFSINYLIGSVEKRSFLELGAGFTGFIVTTPEFTPFFSENKIIPNTYIMYRYQALKSPNTFRIGLTQTKVTQDSKFIWYYPTLSLGHILGRRK